MVTQKGTFRPSTRQTWGKRVEDIVIAVAALMLISPLWLAVVLAIKIPYWEPVFYYQRRIGLRGREFKVIKFRSMIVGADNTSLAASHDPRITRVGKWLRAASLDELPQLINVLRGEMSVVGPRPALPEMVSHYTNEERRRLDVRPGLTGWAQVNGRNALPYHERLRLDVWYVENWSLWLDLVILLRTTPVLIRAQGLSQEDARPWEPKSPLGKD